MRNILLASFLVVLCWAALLRLEGLDRQSFWLDEAVLVLQSKGIHETGQPLMPIGHVDRNSIVATYLISLGHYLPADIHAAARFLPALAGIVSVYAAYMIGFMLFGSRMTGLANAFLCGFSTINIAWSRQVEPYIFVQLFLMLSICGAILAGHRKSIVWLAVSLVFALLCAGSHAGGYVAVVFWIVYAGFLALSGILKGLKDDHFVNICTRKLCVVFVCSVAALILVGVLFWTLPIGHSNPANMMEMLANPYRTNYFMQYLGLWSEGVGLFAILIITIGFIAMLRRKAGLGLAILAASGSYLYLISRVIWTYAERYLFPLENIKNLLLAGGVVVTSSLLSNYVHKSRRRIIVHVLSALALLGFCCFRMDLRFAPGGKYWLGFTAPQPDWRSAFEFVKADAEEHRTGPVTFSPYPLMHDLYIGSDSGLKYYIPISLGGHPDGVSWSAGHVKSIPVCDPEDIQDLSGYLIMDDMALRMLGIPWLRQIMEAKKPFCIVPGPFKVYIWKL